MYSIVRTRSFLLICFWSGCGPAPLGDTEINDSFDCAEIEGSDAAFDPPPLNDFGFPEMHCSPRSSGQGSHKCCSDDPASVGGGRPSFMAIGNSGSATPYFAGVNNQNGSSGMCVQPGQLTAAHRMTEAEADGCPVPCNPTWPDADVVAVCGPELSCCQTRVLAPADCVLDGDVWRPALGTDIVAGRSTWQRHVSHQDPTGERCAAYEEGEQFTDCLAQLSVADQRGFCMPIPAGETCPHADPAFVDACEQINLGLIPPPE